MNPFACAELETENGTETISEVFLRSLGRKPSSRNYYRQALLVFSEGDSSISMERRHLNITTQFIEEKFDVLLNAQQPSIGWLLVVYRNWLFDHSRHKNKETPMTIEHNETLVQPETAFQELARLALECKDDIQLFAWVKWRLGYSSFEEMLDVLKMNRRTFFRKQNQEFNSRFKLA